MAILRATWAGNLWKLARLPSGAADASSARRAAVAGRRNAWDRAARLSGDSSPWDLEYFKASLGAAEGMFGQANELALACERARLEGVTEVRLPVTEGLEGGLRCAAIALRARGQEVADPRGGILDRIRFVAAATAAVAALAIHAARRRQAHTLPVKLPRGGAVALAIHGEWTNRTRHLLERISAGYRPDLLVLLGRLKDRPADVIALWQANGAQLTCPWIHPVSVGAAWRARGRIMDLLRDGLRHIPQRDYIPPFRDHVAIVFRVLLGAVFARWWKEHDPGVATLVLGHTGTADTAMLEVAVRASGGATVHIVHGLASGPNFVAFSDQAIFRSRFDAEKYAALRQYRSCAVQEAPRPLLSRGKAGVFVLTNLAHPLNPRFSSTGAHDEIHLLREVAEACRCVGAAACPMFWKPHPVIGRLAPAVAREIRQEALSLGFEEIAQGQPIVEVAARSRWVITSPSTVSVDLLASGILPIVLDPQGNAAETTMERFPGAELAVDGLPGLMAMMDDEAGYREAFQRTWEQVGPAGPIDLSFPELLKS